MNKFTAILFGASFFLGACNSKVTEIDLSPKAILTIEDCDDVLERLKDEATSEICQLIDHEQDAWDSVKTAYDTARDSIFQIIKEKDPVNYAAYVEARSSYNTSKMARMEQGCPSIIEGWKAVVNAMHVKDAFIPYSEQLGRKKRDAIYADEKRKRLIALESLRISTGKSYAEAFAERKAANGDTSCD